MKRSDFFFKHLQDGVGTQHLVLYRYREDEKSPQPVGTFARLYYKLYSGRVDIDGQTRFLDIDENPDEIMIEQIMSEFGVWE